MEGLRRPRRRPQQDAQPVHRLRQTQRARLEAQLQAARNAQPVEGLEKECTQLMEGLVVLMRAQPMEGLEMERGQLMEGLEMTTTRAQPRERLREEQVQVVRLYGYPRNRMRPVEAQLRVRPKAHRRKTLERARLSVPMHAPPCGCPRSQSRRCDAERQKQDLPGLMMRDVLPVP